MCGSQQLEDGGKWVKLPKRSVPKQNLGNIFLFFHCHCQQFDSLEVGALKLWVKKSMLVYLRRGCQSLRGKEGVSSATFLGLWIALNACLFQLLIPWAALFVKLVLLRWPLVSNVYLNSINAVCFFRYESSDTCWIFYLRSFSHTCEITSVMIPVLLSSDETKCQLHKAKINILPATFTASNSSNMKCFSVLQCNLWE